MNRRFDEMEARFDTVNKRFDDVFSHFDALHAKTDTDDTERLVMTKQLTQHEEWIEQAGEQLGLRYDHVS